MGPPGVGKTLAALALAMELGWVIVEMNALDARNADDRAGRRARGWASFLRRAAPGSMNAASRTLILLTKPIASPGRIGGSLPVCGPIAWRTSCTFARRNDAGLRGSSADSRPR